MKFADRLKVTASGTFAAALTLGAAAANCRTLVQAIASGDIAVGDAGVPFTVDDGAGNWEDSFFTITSSTQITRERVARSSATGAAPTYSGSTLTVYNNPFGESLAGGLVDANDVGFDIVLCFGQSNMEGYPPSDADIDKDHPQVFQWSIPSNDTTHRHQILSTVEPMWTPNGQRTGKTGPAAWFGKAYARTQPSNRPVLLVNCAVGSTGFIGGNGYWMPGNPGAANGGQELTIAEMKLAIDAAVAQYPNSRVVGFIGSLGESDAVAATSQAQFVSLFKTLITNFRTRIPGAANAWCVLMSMTPYARTMYTPAKYDPIDLGHKQIVAELDRMAFVPPVSGMDNNSEHYSSAGIRIMGTRMALAVAAAKRSVGADTTAPTILSAIVSAAAPSTVTITFSEPIDQSSIPSVAALASVVAGHTVSSVTPGTNTLTLGLTTPFTAAESRSLTYAKPATNFIKDLVGNALADGATLTITNNVVAADTTAPKVSTTTLPAIPNAAANTIVITFDEALAAGNPPASAFIVTGAQSTVSSVAVSGLTVTLTMGAAYTNGQAANVSYSPTGTNDLQDAAGNKVVAFGPLAVTNNVAAGSTGGGTTYATLSPTDHHANITISGGNLVATSTSGAGFFSARGSAGCTTGVRQFEAKMTAGASGVVGLGIASTPLTTFPGGDNPAGASMGWYNGGQRYVNNGNVGSLATWTTNDVLGVIADFTAKTIEFTKNGVSQGVFAMPDGMLTALNAGNGVFPMVATNGNAFVYTMNFGATAFAYPKSGATGWPA